MQILLFLAQEDIKMSQQVKKIKVAISENLINGIDLQFLVRLLEDFNVMNYFVIVKTVDNF